MMFALHEVSKYLSASAEKVPFTKPDGPNLQVLLLLQLCVPCVQSVLLAEFDLIGWPSRTTQMCNVWRLCRTLPDGIMVLPYATSLK